MRTQVIVNINDVQAARGVLPKPIIDGRTMGAPALYTLVIDTDQTVDQLYDALGTVGVGAIYIATDPEFDIS